MWWNLIHGFILLYYGDCWFHLSVLLICYLTSNTILGAFQNHFQNRRRNSLAVNHLLMGKQPLTRKKSSQQRFVFAEKSSTSKRDSKTMQENSRLSEDRDSDDEDSERRKKSPERNLFEITPVAENVANFCMYPDSNNCSNSCCDNKAMASKTKNVSKSSVIPKEELQNTCSCSSSFTCPSHISTFEEKPSSVNPFPTKRRVGSMKTKSTNVHGSKQ